MANNGLGYRQERAPQIVASLCPLPEFLSLHTYINIHTCVVFMCVTYTHTLLLGTDSNANEVK